MSSLVDRLRSVLKDNVGRATPPHGAGAVGAPGAGAPGGPDKVHPTIRPQTTSDAAETLGGEWRELRGERFLVIDRKYTPGHRHGHVAVADTLPPDESCWSRFALLNGVTTPVPRDGKMLFIDLETTGLAGGAGTYAFLVGCAWYQGGTLRVRQFFLTNFAAERVLLEAVAEVADACGTLVTYNGKSFDLPLIETRFLLHRLETPFAGIPHVDMLHPARRLWRDEVEEGCRLSALEQTQCGHVREGDVPGFEIPSRYFHFVRTGDPRGLAAVMEHNRLDLISLAVLTARASQLLEDGPAAARTGREALGMGRLYERAGLMIDACASFLRAAEHGQTDTVTRAEAWRAYAVLSRRERRYGDAANGWRRILELRHCPPAIVREASEALAVHHEHRLRDLQAARAFALQSLDVSGTRSRQESTRYRLARIERKLGDSGAVTAPLF